MKESQYIFYITGFISALGFIIPQCIMFFSAIMFGMWLKPFIRRKRLCITAGVVLFLFSLSNLFISEEIPHIFIYMLAMFVSFCILYFGEKRNGKLKLFLCVIYLALWYSVMGFTCEINFFITHLFEKNEFLMAYVWTVVMEFVLQELFFLLLSSFMLYFSVSVFHKCFSSKQENMTWNELGFMLLPAVPIFFSRSLHVDYIKLWNDGILNGTIKENYPANIYWAIYCIMSYVVILVVVILYEKNKNELCKNRELELAKSNNEALLSHLKRTEKLYEEQRSLRHDLANHIQTLEGLIHAGRQEASGEYLNNLKEELCRITPEVITGNPVTDIILSEYKDTADDSGVLFATNFVYPMDVKINAFDISVILNNALSNAFREVAFCEKPYVKVTSSQKKNVMLIEVVNNYMGEIELDDVTGFPVSPAGHGIGLKNIKHTAEKYHGTIDIELKKNENEKEFLLTVMLQLD